MPLAMLTGRAPELISDPLGLRPVADSDVVLVDAETSTPPNATTSLPAASAACPPNR
jgi:arginase